MLAPNVGSGRRRRLLCTLPMYADVCGPQSRRDGALTRSSTGKVAFCIESQDASLGGQWSCPGFLLAALRVAGEDLALPGCCVAARDYCCNQGVLDRGHRPEHKPRAGHLSHSDATLHNHGASRYSRELRAVRVDCEGRVSRPKRRDRPADRRHQGLPGSAARPPRADLPHVLSRSRGHPEQRHPDLLVPARPRFVPPYLQRERWPARGVCGREMHVQRVVPQSDPFRILRARKTRSYTKGAMKQLVIRWRCGGRCGRAHRVRRLCLTGVLACDEPPAAKVVVHAPPAEKGPIPEP